MPPINPVISTKPRKVRVTAKAKSTAPPRQADQGSAERRQPVVATGKVRMYAHPQRPAAQQVFAQQKKDAAAQTPAAQKRQLARIKVTPVASPDSQDSNRSPAQLAHDAQVVAQNVRVSREKVLRERGRGSGARAVGKVLSDIAKADLTSTASTGAGPTVHVVAPGHGRVRFAAMEPVSRNVTVDDTTAAGSFIRNATSDAGELLVTTPSSVAKLASTAVTHPKKLPGMLAKPYIDLVKHPVHTFTERPFSTALMLAPAVRMPGRAAGKVARVTGKQTLARPAATLPGTALKEARTGSRDLAVRVVQSRRDAKNPPPTVTAKQVQQRVDHHYDASKQESHRIVGEAVKAAEKATKGQPKDVRAAAIEHAREQAQQTAKAVAEERFAREFGANERLSAGTVQREALHGARRQAVKVLDSAKVAMAHANAAHDAAHAAARAALAKARTSPTLASLESLRRDAQRDLAKAVRAQSTARAAHGVAKGRAEVLSRNVGGGGKAGGYGVQIAQGGLDAAATAIRDHRARIAELDQQIGLERKRISGVPPAQHQALLTAIHDRGQAKAVLAVARADAHAAAHAHINAKKAMTNATLVQPAGEGRLFAHKADAATVVKKLNQAGTPITRGKGYRFTVHDASSPRHVTLEKQTAGTAEPLKFVLRQVGEDRWAAVPHVAAERLMNHHVVGTSPATMAKVMRTSRGAFTNAVLPLSAKWLAGQGAEAGIRSAVAGAGPMDWLRMGKVVKELNKKQPGAGDALATRISGGQFGLTGPARDFAAGKSLATEFDGTPLGQPAAAVTFAGQAAPLRGVRHGWKQYTRVVLDLVNHTIESNARKAMAGQAIKNLGFQDLHVNGLSEAALEDAAKGLQGTHNQVALARAVDRMYGRYQKFSPDTRSLLLHWTPFLPWYLNTAKFLLRVLPMDHPVITAVLADTNMVEEEWRKSHNISLHGPHVPWYMLGSYPTKDGKYRNLAHYTPWGVGADPVGASGDLMLPQFLGPLKNAGGVDWKWQRLTHGGKHGTEFNQGEKAIRALVTAAEEQVPGVSQVGKVSGLTPRYVDKASPDSVKSPGEALKSYLPWTPMSNNQPTTTGAPSSSSGRVKIPGASGARIKIPGVGSGRIKIP